jgi:hypothetical protein
MNAVGNEPSAYPMKEEAEDEDEDEDDGCRRDRAPSAYYLLFRAEPQRLRDRKEVRCCVVPISLSSSFDLCASAPLR